MERETGKGRGKHGDGDKERETWVQEEGDMKRGTGRRRQRETGRRRQRETGRGSRGEEDWERETGRER